MHPHRAYLSQRVPTLLVATVIAVAAASSLLAPAYAADEAPKEAATDELSRIPGRFTLSGGASDAEIEAYGDFLFPLWQTENRGMLFLNPRVSATDLHEEEFNLGLGWRKMVSLGEYEAIVGVNGYYDSRWTASDTHWNQFGFGLEFLSEWLDGRFNYYIPEQDKKLVDTFETEETTVSKSSSTSTESEFGAIFPEGNAFKQNVRLTTKSRTVTTTTTTRFVFEQYESALEGFDLEIGTKIPGLDKVVETRVYLGYQSFDNPFGEDFEGLRGRAEIRAVAGLFIDAAVFEDEELNNSDYYVGARLNVPLDLVNLTQGRNPFEGASDGFRWERAKGLSRRMSEQVIRDVKVRTLISDPVENVGARTSNSKKSSRVRTVSESTEDVVLIDNIQFVNNNGVKVARIARGDGTYENPWLRITEGVDHASDLVYVYDSPTTYRENVVVPQGIRVYSSYLPIVGMGGFTYGGDTGRPKVRGDGRSPTFIMRNKTEVAGFKITNPASKGRPLPRSKYVSPNGHGTYDVSRAGIGARERRDLVIRDNVFENVKYGIVLVDTLARPGGSFSATITDNRVNGGDRGIIVDTRGAPGGTYNVLLENNRVTDQDNTGFAIDAQRYHDAKLSVIGSTANNNRKNGFNINLRDNINSSELLMRDIKAEGNGDGIRIQRVSATGNATATFEDIKASSNRGNGMFFEGRGAESTALGDATLTMRKVQAGKNGDRGLYFSSDGVRSINGTAKVELDDITASNNGNAGVYFRRNGAYSMNTGDAIFKLSNYKGNNNSGAGFRVEDAAARARSGSALLTLSDSRANDNSVDGFAFGSAGAASEGGGSAQVTVSEVTANDNRFHGMAFSSFAAYASDGPATTTFEDLTLKQNGYSGLRAGTTAAKGAGHDARVRLTGSTVRGNTTGVELTVQSSGGTAGLLGERNVLIKNGKTGLYLNSSSGVGRYDLNLGDAAAGTAGFNTIRGHGGYDIYNSSSASLLAQNNFWGPGGPVNNSGPVNAVPFLTTDPN